LFRGAQERPLRLAHHRMHDAFELRERIRLADDLRGQKRAVHLAAARGARKRRFDGGAAAPV
jgi:hypothetical protein